ncbi:MAG: nucleoside-diphosphate kinase [Candidatus Heimdallarchaeota archaeon]|jgi:nucleoside-diphosphate kinase|nr:nucleoside-diphosphate kinase [Candidatus Heimdallarchaeota archaeon]MBY8995442.1 nucleoside-diphosphate kinase [Candidatus Heimdallarchaeota archaeon]
MSDIERSFVMVKPDAVKRRLIGDIISRLEKVGLRIVAMRMLQLTKAMAEEHYAIHKDKPFFDGLVKFISSGPVIAMVVEGKDAVKRVRKLAGATKPMEAEVGTIRGDLAMEIGRNVVHAADSPENAKIEYSIYFKASDFVKNPMLDEDWVYE